jgi:hypothetical protein
MYLDTTFWKKSEISSRIMNLIIFRLSHGDRKYSLLSEGNKRKLTIRTRFSGTVPEIGLMSRADFVPDYLKKITQAEICIEY